ncbi:MAG TPA: calcium/sodium antiporter [Longimicrobiales bacterium]|nr:calcium/sodium antiporter [Longimicrobiales bacterium]
MLETILFLFGLAGLWGGTLLTVRGAVDVSERHGLSQGFIGLTILAIGTDLPELLVSVSGSLQQLRGIESSGVIVGNAIGSAMAQGTLVLGVAGLFGTMGIAPRMIRRDGLTLLLAIALTTILCWDGDVGRLQGAALLIAYLIYFVSLVQAEHGHGEARTHRDARGPSPMFALFVGLVTVILAAHVVVTEAVELADSWGISQTLVGVLLIALGTSLPELALSIGAMRQGHTSLSVGNVIGSNIFDLLVPVGLAAVIHPLVVDDTTTAFDLPAVALATAALLVFMTRRRGLQRGEAIALIGLYVAYAALRVLMA